MNGAARLERRLASMSELLEVVGAMRSIAAVRVQEAQHALQPVRRYAADLAQAIGSALLLAPEADATTREPRSARLLILCAAEHSFVGAFNERLLQAAAANGAAHDRLFIVGTRGAALAHERGPEAAWTAPMATRLESVPQLVERLSAEIYAGVARRTVAGAEVMFMRQHATDGPEVLRHRLLPLDRSAFALRPAQLPPLHHLPAGVLLEKLIAEYVFALLTEAAVESLASENAARFSATDAAHDKISRRIEQLRRDAQVARQSEITTELLDVVTGAQALGED